jgi:dTDP-4-amino-4,6-dideoxygalactose transaminase
MKTEAFPKKVWLSSPTMHGDELKYMTEAYQTNWMSTEGANLTEVERVICEKIGCKYAVPLSSGTAALHLAVKLAGVQQGDRVFCSDMTFDATVNAIVYEKAIPVFIDSEYETWNMDPVALEKAFELYPDTKVIVVVNLYGTPAKFDEICAIAQKHGAVIVEDAAESFGAYYKGKPTGTFGTYNVISFNGNKIITGSSGGALLTDDEQAAEKAKKWSTQSRENAPWYQHEEIGYNYRMSNVIAGVVRGQLPYLEEHIAQKKAIYERYQKGFEGLPVTMNPYDSETMVPNYWLSCMLIDTDAMCKQERTDTQTQYVTENGKTCPDEILETLEAYNAQGRPIWKPMHLQPLYKDHGFVTAKGELKDTPWDVSADIFQRGLCLPSDNKMTIEEQDKIIELIRNCFN